MTNAQHTPGPWTAEWSQAPDNGLAYDSLDIYGAEGECLATLRNANKDANARLIAAAPELLAALNSICDLPADDNGDRVVLAGFLDEARAAIAKATGKGE